MPHDTALTPDLHGGDKPHEEDVTIPISIALEAALVLVNLLPICVVLRYKKPKERQATDELIVALSLTDILSVLVPSPIGLAAYFHHRWLGGPWTCDFYQLSVVWFQLTSMCLVTFMCVDRWLSLRGAMAYRQPPISHRRTRLTVVGICVFTFCVSSLPLMGLAPDAYSSLGEVCHSWLISRPGSPAQHVFFLVFLSVGYANLLAAIMVNCTVIVTLWRFQRKFGIKPSERVNGCAMQIDRRTVVEFSIMVLIVTAIFYLAWLPALTMITVQQLGIEVGQVAVVYSLLSTTLTGLLNPVIYGTFSKAYRLAYTRLIVAASKLLFGCPLTQEDVLADISSQARHMRSSASINNSSATLINGHSDGVIGSRSDYAEVSAITHSNGTARSLQYALEGSTCQDSTVINPCDTINDTQVSTRRDTLDMHERAYFGELLSQRDSAYGEISRGRFGSSLSLISEDSAELIDDRSSTESLEGAGDDQGLDANYGQKVFVRESMI